MNYSHWSSQSFDQIVIRIISINHRIGHLLIIDPITDQKNVKKNYKYLGDTLFVQRLQFFLILAPFVEHRKIEEVKENRKTKNYTLITGRCLFPFLFFLSFLSYFCFSLKPLYLIKLSSSSSSPIFFIIFIFIKIIFFLLRLLISVLSPIIGDQKTISIEQIRAN